VDPNKFICFRIRSCLYEQVDMFYCDIAVGIVKVVY
jgi:hypothetical protein